MKLTLSSPKSILASETTTTLTATLKTEKGVPVAGETIRFQLTPGKTRGLMSSTNKPVAVTVTTDSKGLAKATVSVPRIPYSDTEFRGYTVTALYKGKAKKYCLTESAPTGVSQIKEKTAFVLAPTWDGHTGTRTFTSKLAVSGGPNDGKVISGVPIEWRFCKSGSVSPYYHSDSNAKTNSEGITSTTWTLQTGNLGGQSDWLDYDVTLFAQSGSMRSTPYAPPAFKTYKLNKKQGIKYYTLDMSKVIERCYDGSASWFTASAAQKIFLRIASTENVFVDINGIPLAESISISSSDPNRFIKCSVGKVVASMMYDEFAADIPLTFSLNAQNRILLGEGSSGTNRIEVPSAYRDATSLQVTLTLPTFEDGIYPEYKYVPINGTVSKTFGE